MNVIKSNEIFSLTLKSAYENSVIPEILLELHENFKGIEEIIDQLEKLSYLLLLNSLCEQNKALSNLSLHMAFTGKIGTGKNSIALKIAQILRDLNYLSKGHLTSVTREDFIGQYIGHTAPKTREILQKSEGGVLFIDQSHKLYQPDNEKDYGAEAIEVILQVMENQRDDLVLIFSDEKEKLDEFFNANPGISSRIGNHIHFNQYSLKDLEEIFNLLLKKEGGFFLEEGVKKEISFYLKQFLDLSNFANIRTLQLLIHQLILCNSESIYNNNLKKNIKGHNLLKIPINIFLSISSNDFRNIIGVEENFLPKYF